MAATAIIVVERYKLLILLQVTLNLKNNSQPVVFSFPNCALHSSLRTAAKAKKSQACYAVA